MFVAGCSSIPEVLFSVRKSEDKEPAAGGYCYALLTVTRKRNRVGSNGSSQVKTPQLLARLVVQGFEMTLVTADEKEAPCRG